MKRFVLLSTIFAVLFTVSCSHIDEQIDSVDGMTITTIDGYINDDLSRTYAEAQMAQFVCCGVRTIVLL